MIAAGCAAEADSNAMSDQTQSTEWLWPDLLDAVAAAPASHRVLLENDSVRVVEVVIEPGAKEPPHTHRWPSVMIIDRSTRIRYYDENDSLAYESPERVEEKTTLRVEWMEPEGLHAVENIDEMKYHAIRVELKDK
jgi:predicted metal-dependent enzyme (double-stranded beta helix superfamily)